MMRTNCSVLKKNRILQDEAHGVLFYMRDRKPKSSVGTSRQAMFYLTSTRMGEVRGFLGWLGSTSTRKQPSGRHRRVPCTRTGQDRAGLSSD